jgi:CRP-like cAMP-binding protein
MNNRLLSLLPVADQQRLLADCDRVTLSQHQIVIESEELIEYVYFPVDCVISQLTTLTDGNVIESASIGNEGYVGLTSYLGAETSPLRFMVQVPGEAMRISATKLRDWAHDVPRLQVLLGRYGDFLLVAASQTTACNRQHSVQQRSIRWLLRLHDRLPGDEFPLTQELLAQMLGVRRASVSIAAGILQGAGLIRYTYGHVVILDREGLEQAACECAEVIRHRYETLFSSLLG